MRTSTYRDRVRPRAFTLIEILVAMAVFLLIALLVVQMSDSTMLITNHSERRIGADGNALLAIDRISADLARAIVRSDLPWRVQKQSGNDRFAFFAYARAYEPGRGISKIGYRVEDSMLQRGVQAASWDNSGPAALTFIPDGTAGIPDYLEIDEANFEFLDPNIFRLEISFLNAEGDIVSEPAYAGDGLVDFAPSRRAEPRDRVLALIVTVASVDERARNLIDPEELSGLSGKFPDAISGKSPMQTWQEYLSDGGTGLSQPAREAIRFKQRHIPIGP